MKKILHVAFAALACAATSFAAEVGTEIDLTSTVRGRVIHSSGTTNYIEVFANPESKPTGFLEIRNTYTFGDETYFVSRVAANGFENCAITHIQLPPDCYMISAYAFNNCTSLTAVTEYEPGSIEVIGDYAFQHTTKLTELSLPGVESVGNFAFWIAGIESVSLPAIKTLGAGAFRECASLTTFNGGEKLEEVGNIAFANSTKLTGITLGPELRTIGSTAFGYILDMHQVVVPASTQSLGNNAFDGTALTRVFILAPNFMDYCDASKLLAHTAMEEIYCLPELVFNINYYLSVGGDASPAETLAKCQARSITGVLDFTDKGQNKFAAKYGISGITDLHVYDAVTGEEIEPQDGLYVITADKARVSYRVDGINLLDYETAINHLSGISEIEAEEGSSQAVEYYTIDGRKLDRPAATGIYIERKANGTAHLRTTR